MAKIHFLAKNEPSKKSFQARKNRYVQKAHKALDFINSVAIIFILLKLYGVI